MSVESVIWSHYGKVVMLLLIVIVILQAYHMTKLMSLQETNTRNMNMEKRLQEKQIRSSDAASKSTAGSIKRDILLGYIEKVENPHLMDTSGTYIIVHDIVTPVSEDLNETLSLCTQTSANHLHYLKDLTETWHGPVSVTVFTYGHEAAYALYSIVYMHTCFKKVMESVRFHLAYPISHPVKKLESIMNMEMHCDNFENLIDEDKRNYENDIPYPHNVLRNIAVRYSSTPYILMIDIDMIPSQDLQEHFTRFIRRHSSPSIKGDKSKDDKIVYVVPAFELRNNHKSLDKQSLLKEWDLQNVRPFYRNVCWKCQRVTDYDKWRELPNLPFMDVGYILEWEDPWEPFYIARKDNLPLYDSRFKQYGFNRISQTCELHIAGYKFAVLNNAFLVHRGFKEVTTFHEKKDAENDKNRELFKIFKGNLKERYPNSNRTC